MMIEPDEAERIAEQMRATSAAFEQVMVVLAHQAEVVAEVFTQVWEVMSQSFTEAVQSMTQDPFFQFVTHIDPRWLVMEDAARVYARWYNVRHPGRRVSWRRLSRVQAWEALQRCQHSQPK